MRAVAGRWSRFFEGDRTPQQFLQIGLTVALERPDHPVILHRGQHERMMHFAQQAASRNGNGSHAGDFEQNVPVKIDSAYRARVPSHERGATKSPQQGAAEVLERLMIVDRGREFHVGHEARGIGGEHGEA